jgi:hypothetical protein
MNIARGVPGSRRGMALVFALAMIIIISALILAYLLMMRLDRQAAFSYGHSVKAAELALGALQEITSNLEQEIDAGSTVSTSGSTTVYTPLNNHTAAPAHLGFGNDDYAIDPGGDKLPRTVLQASRFEAEYPADAGYESDRLPANHASAVSSATPSANRRTVSATRWNKPLFMSGSQPMVPEPFKERPPQWIYATREGSRPCTDGEAKAGALSLDTGSNPNAVLGRYAYVIYDESALLDINAAGYIYSATTGAAYRDTVRGKSFLAYADLTKVPGLADIGTAENLVRWRNQGGLKINGGDYAKLVANSATAGFLQFTGTDSVHDNPLLGRQDLIDYLNKVTGSGSAAPYLTTFSRAIAAPSWHPVFDAENPTAALPYNTSAATYRYKTNADKPDGINRNLANVRFTSAGNVTHYFDDGGSQAYTVGIGDLLLASRFSLKRIQWLANNPFTGIEPRSQYEDAVLKCFGLHWGYPGGNSNTAANGGNKCWNYVDAGGNYATTIKTLAEVAGEHREPNFFELLKASILNGSLGRAPGPAAFNNGNNYKNDYSIKDRNESTGPAGLYCLNLDPLNNGGTVPAPAQIPDLQIMQIGANIIDQYDEDYYPTAIYFNYDGVGEFDPANGPRASLRFGPVSMVYGNENLPYLTRAANVNCSTNRANQDCQNGENPTENDVPTDTIAGWIQPEIWNPHQEPAAAPAPELLPRHFQIRAYGGAYTYWSYNNDYTVANNATGAVNFQKRPINGRSDTTEWHVGKEKNEPVIDIATIDITDNSATSSFYTNPFMLRNEPWNYPDVLVTSASINLAQPSYVGVSRDKKIYGTAWNNFFVGFSTGTTSVDYGRPAPFAPYYIKVSYENGVLKKNGSLPVSDQGKIDSYFDSDGIKAGSFVLGWVSGGNFHPYSFLAGAFPYQYSSVESFYHSLGEGHPPRDGGRGQNRWISIDPRTTRFSFGLRTWDGEPGLNNFTAYDTPKGKNKLQTQTLFPQNPAHGFSPISSNASDRFPQNFMINSATLPAANQAPFTATQYYRDPDGIIRPGDGYYVNPATGDGIMLSKNQGNPSGTKIALGDNTASITKHGRRPVILNRPFRSVGELGYVFRDLPFKTLDFFSPASADAALLDVFSLVDETRITDNQIGALVGGQFNPSNSPRPVIEAVLAGAGKKDLDPAYNLGDADNPLGNAAAQIAQNITTHFANGALLNRAGLVTELGGAIHEAFAFSADKGNKAYYEAPIRALSGVVQTRTWNLMIDLITQSGRIAPNAANLGDFIVQGERRYWLHIAIDRYTGKVIAQQLEPIHE